LMTFRRSNDDTGKNVYWMRAGVRIFGEPEIFFNATMRFPSSSIVLAVLEVTMDKPRRGRQMALS
jgi:hypothetical protein